MSIPTTDCLRCGVCCHSKLDTYVRLSGDDWERLGAETGRVAHFIGNRAYMRMSEHGHCAALEVRATMDGEREFFCTVYEKRPQICRDLARGSPECEGELLAKAGRVASA
ncbi:MAG: YkgJ family cysteine cluster protein [Rariglobus sp.]|nr:YkgJ family cysteine cluster protein [Rariglobus sp.]